MRFDMKKFLGKTLVVFLLLFSKTLFAAPQQLQIVGIHTQTMGGCNFRLTGVNCSGLEYSPGGFGAPSGYGGDIKQTITGAVNTWKANIVRIPLSQDYWFGNGGANQTTYRNIVDGAIATATSLNCYVELDLQWSGTGTWGTATGQQSMPDSNARAFWHDVAGRYANNPGVIFDLFNEPYTTSWTIWKNGGTASEGFSTPGFQQLVKDVRDTGAKNIISVGGLGYSWNMTGVQANALTDTNTGNTLTGYGIMYEAHIYDNKGGTTEASKIALWNSNVTVAVTAGFCVMMGEFGPGSGQDASGCTPFESDLLSWINGNNTASYTYNAMAWNFSTEASPCLLSSWSGFTATACHGAQVKSWLAAITPPNCGATTPVNTAVLTKTNTPAPSRTTTPTLTSTMQNSPSRTATMTSTRTNTAVPPTATFTGTATFTRTNTAIPPSATFTRTNTAMPPSATSTSTLTFTAVNTPVPPTKTSTPIQPTSTFTAVNTPVPPTSTFTAVNTPVPPTSTFTAVNTPIPPTSTPVNTTIPPTSTPVDTPIPPTSTPVNTPIPPTSTPTAGIATTSIKIKLKEADNNNSTNSPHPQFLITNTGTQIVYMNNVEVRYWFNCDSSSGSAQVMQVYVDWAGRPATGANITTNVIPVVAATSLGNQTQYLSFKFNGNLTLGPGESIEVQSRFNKSDWSQMLQSNDWSYTNTAVYIDWNKVTGYINGSLVYGIEPGATTGALTVASVITYPNAAVSGAGATIKYTLAGSSAGGVAAQGETEVINPDAIVALRIFTSAGRLIWKKTVTGASNVSTGEHAIYWDGKTGGSYKLSTGIYTLQVEVSSAGSSGKGYSRIVLVN